MGVTPEPMSNLRLFVASADKLWAAWRNRDGRYQWLPGEVVEQAKVMMADHPAVVFGDPVLEQIAFGGLERGLPYDSGYLVVFPVGESD